MYFPTMWCVGPFAERSALDVALRAELERTGEYAAS